MLQRFESDAVQKTMRNSMYCNGHGPTNDDVKILKQLIDGPPMSLQEMNFLTPCVSFLTICFISFVVLSQKLLSHVSSLSIKWT